jgi:hypothetical protein
MPQDEPKYFNKGNIETKVLRLLEKYKYSQFKNYFFTCVRDYLIICLIRIIFLTKHFSIATNEK